MWLISLLACLPDEPGRGVVSAEPSACISGPLVFEGGRANRVLTGRAVAVGPAQGHAWDFGVRCDDATRLLSIQDSDNTVWTIGYGWSEGGSDVAPNLGVSPDATIDLTFRGVDGATTAAGFIVTEGGTLHLALEVGGAGPALLGGDVPGVRVSQGEITGSDRDPDCGRRVAREVRFTTDDAELSLETIGSAALEVDGQDMTAWALASWGWENLSCEDASGELSWGLVR